jgi:hypothetical protein
VKEKYVTIENTLASCHMITWTYANVDEICIPVLFFLADYSTSSCKNLLFQLKKILLKYEFTMKELSGQIINVTFPEKK